MSESWHSIMRWIEQKGIVAQPCKTIGVTLLKIQK